MGRQGEDTNGNKKNKGSMTEPYHSMLIATPLLLICLDFSSLLIFFKEKFKLALRAGEARWKLWETDFPRVSGYQDSSSCKKTAIFAIALKD